MRERDYCVILINSGFQIQVRKIHIDFFRQIDLNRFFSILQFFSLRLYENRDSAILDEILGRNRLHKNDIYEDL